MHMWNTHVQLTPEQGYDTVSAQRVAIEVALSRLTRDGLIMIPNTANCYQITGAPGDSRTVSLSCYVSKKVQVSLL
jgi:hypothetical protein